MELYFNEFNQRIRTVACSISAYTYHLLRGDHASSKMNDEHLENLFNKWRAESRGFDAACQTSYYTDRPMPRMPLDDKEHLACRRMAAVNLERILWGEHTAQEHLESAIEDIKNSPFCANHPETCACKQTLGWTYGNLEALKALKVSKVPKVPEPVPDTEFVKMLFKTVQGVNYDDKCPHQLPFYACMSCSH